MSKKSKLLIILSLVFCLVACTSQFVYAESSEVFVELVVTSEWISVGPSTVFPEGFPSDARDRISYYCLFVNSTDFIYMTISGTMHCSLLGISSSEVVNHQVIPYGMTDNRVGTFPDIRYIFADGNSYLTISGGWSFDSDAEVKYSSGLISVQNESYRNGYNSGYSMGQANGYQSGYSEGFSEGTSEGTSEGYSDGYSAGLIAGLNELSTVDDYQLIDYSLINSRSYLGVTLTKNADNTITLTGTATGDIKFTLCSFPISDHGTHLMLAIGAPAGSSSTSYHFGDLNKGYYSFDVGNGAIFTAQTSSPLVPCLFVSSGTVLPPEGVTFNPKYYDLTEMFGPGYEPANVTEFNQLYNSVLMSGVVADKTAAAYTRGFNEGTDQSLVIANSVDWFAGMIGQVWEALDVEIFPGFSIATFALIAIGLTILGALLGKKK